MRNAEEALHADLRWRYGVVTVAPGRPSPARSAAYSI